MLESTDRLSSGFSSLLLPPLASATRHGSLVAESVVAAELFISRHDHFAVVVELLSTVTTRHSDLVHRVRRRCRV